MTSGGSGGRRGRAKKNVVVLAGWLGCKRKSLRRYETMYRDMGWDVVIRIASPTLVVTAASGIDDDTSTDGGGSIDKATSRSKAVHVHKHPPGCMRELALQTLREVHDSQCNAFIFHAFSNGGAFLWEEISDILKRENGNADDRRYSTMRKKLAGVVFDSSPSYYADVSQDTTNEALSYATEEEQKDAKTILEKARLEMGDQAFEQSRTRRAREYWQTMRNDDLNVPHLYLYSKVDRLAPYKALDELIKHRRKVFGKDNITALNFVDTPHCSHLVKYPSEYQLALKRFLTACLANNISVDKSTVRSRL